MLTHWWIENRWVLTKRTLFAIDCVIILLIPFMHPPYSYVSAVFVVVSLLIFFRDFSSNYRQTGSDR